MFKALINNNTITIKEDEKILFETKTTTQTPSSFDIFGIYGVLIFNTLKLLILVNEAVKVGEYKGSDVFEIRKVKIEDISEYISDSKTNEINHLKKLIHKFFNLPGIYFSQADLHRNLIIQEMNEKYNDEFLFNKKPIENLKKINEFEISNVVLKCIQGFFKSENGITLISRRCPKRAGSRYFSRGISDDGYPSNFVETEQIVENRISYIQLRGSIPLKWKHSVGLAYKPSIHVNNENTKKISHDLLQNIYKKPVRYLNLIHNKGYESILYEKFNEFYEILNYDIKKEFNDIKKMKSINEMIRNSCTVKDGRFVQNEIIRTNCIDCLDRTNSMQFIIGCEILKTQLDCQLKNQSNKRSEVYKDTLMNLYYENGNNLSHQYAGTKAMASYLMTNEHFNMIKKIEDVYLSLYRYFINRYSHGYLHDSYEIVTGMREKGNITKNRRMRYALIVLVPLFIGIILKSKITSFFKYFLIFAVSVILCQILIDYPTFI